MAHNQKRRPCIFFLLNSLFFFCFALLLSPLFSPLFLHVCILNIYQKAPGNNLIRVQREMGCMWHQPVASPGEGRQRRALDVHDSDIDMYKREKAVNVFKMDKGIPITIKDGFSFQKTYSLLFCSGAVIRNSKLKSFL